MTVLHLISSEGYYGAEAVLVSLARNSANLGCDTVVAVFGDSRGPHIEVAEQARSCALPVEIVPVKGRWDWNAVRGLRKLAAAYEIDLLHAHGYKADCYAWLAAWPSRFPLISTCHNWPDRRRLMRLYAQLDRWMLRGFDRAVAVSDSVAAILRNADVSERKIVTIPNGVDVERFSGAQPSLRQNGWENRPIVGFVGRLVECKGGPVLLRAAQTVLRRFPDVVFALVGEGPLRQAWESLATRLGIASNVVFLGAQRDMPGIYSSLDMLVLPSLDEAMPMCVLEAQAAARAVIATHVGGLPKLIIPGITGILVEPGDPQGLADAIARLLMEPQLAQQLGENARLHVARHHSSQSMAARYIAQYRAIVSGHSHGEHRLVHSAHTL